MCEQRAAETFPFQTPNKGFHDEIKSGNSADWDGESETETALIYSVFSLVSHSREIKHVASFMTSVSLEK